LSRITKYGVSPAGNGLCRPIVAEPRVRRNDVGSMT
jgi:hypothetical protein